MKSKIKYVIRDILIVGICLFLGLIIFTNLETRKSNKTQGGSGELYNESANIEAEKDIQFTTERIKDNLGKNNTDIFTIGDKNTFDKNKLTGDYEGKVLIFVDCNVIKNKGMNFKIDSLKKNNGDFYITYEYSLPQSNSVIGEKDNKDNILLIISLNDLKYGNNEFVFKDNNSANEPIMLTYKRDKINPEKQGSKLVNPVVSMDNKYIAYMSNTDYSWNMYEYDITNKKSKVISEKHFFENINDKNDNNYADFPEYVWIDDNILVYTNSKSIERAKAENGAVGVVYSPVNGGKLSHLIYSAAVKGIYFIETTDLDKSIVKFSTINTQSVNSVCIEQSHIINISVSPREDQIAYITYDSSAQKNRYTIKIYGLKDKKTKEIYQGDCINEIDWLDNDNVVFVTSKLKNLCNNLYSIKTNKTNFREITHTEDVTYSNVNAINGKIYFARNFDEYKELWIINGVDINKVSTIKLIGNYTINSTGTSIEYAGQDYSLYEMILNKGITTKLVSSKLEVAK